MTKDRAALIAAVSMLTLSSCYDAVSMNNESEEVRLLVKIAKMPVGAERDSLIDRLEDAPVHHLTFYERWLLVHDVIPFWDCWSDDGYDPSKSKFPRDVQLLAAAGYGKSDIDNGGFHQFFGNGTGVFAPEMAEWLERAGLTKGASIVRKAMAVFGPEFPRSQDARQEFLSRFGGESREEWDPFFELDDRFYAATKDELFDEAGNRWLRDVCGIKRLRDGY